MNKIYWVNVSMIIAAQNLFKPKAIRSQAVTMSPSSYVCIVYIHKSMFVYIHKSMFISVYPAKANRWTISTTQINEPKKSDFCIHVRLL